MKVTLMLADHAQAVQGKLFISGGGATTVTIGTPFGIALIVEVPWDQANERHEFRLRLLDEDGQAVLLPGPNGASPLEVGGSFEVGRPPGTKKGSRLPFPLALNFGPMPLAPDTLYVWALDINGQSSPDWQLVFSAVPPAQLTTPETL